MSLWLTVFVHLRFIIINAPFFRPALVAHLAAILAERSDIPIFGCRNLAIYRTRALCFDP